MIDRQELREVAGAVSLGLLSEDLVLSVGRLLRKDPLEAADYQALQFGKSLMERLGSQSRGALVASGTSRIDTDESDLDVYRAVRIQSPNEPARELLNRFAGLLDRAIRGELSPDDEPTVILIRQLFARVGELTLARTDDLFERSRMEHLEWMGTARSFHS